MVMYLCAFIFKITLKNVFRQVLSLKCDSNINGVSFITKIRPTKVITISDKIFYNAFLKINCADLYSTLYRSSNIKIFRKAILFCSLLFDSLFMNITNIKGHD